MPKMSLYSYGEDRLKMGTDVGLNVENYLGFIVIIKEKNGCQ